MRNAIILTIAYGVVAVAVLVVLLLTGAARSELAPATTLQVLASCATVLTGALAPVALAWLVRAVVLLDRVETQPAPQAEQEQAEPGISAEAARVEDRRDFFNSLERYRTSLYNQFIEVFQDTGLIDAYRVFKFPDGLPMVDRPCIFLVVHCIGLEQRGEPLPERFNLDNEELQILRNMFDEMVGHAKRTSSTFVLRRNDMRVYQMLGGQYP